MSVSLRIISLSLLGSITVLPLLILPVMVGAMVEGFGFSESQAGIAASFGFVGGALAAIPISLRVHHLNLRQLFIFGFSISIVADFVSAYSADREAFFMAVRFLGGLGGGAAYTAVVTAIARLANPDQGYGLFMAFQFALSAVGLYWLPGLIPTVGAEGLYVGLALVSLVSLLLAPTLPNEIVASPSDAAAIEARTILRPAALLALIGIGFYEAANTAQFAYVERMGDAIALTGDQLGLALGVSSIIGVPAALAVVYLGPRLGRLFPALLAVATAIVALLILIFVKSYAAYFVALCMLGAAWAFGLPYFQSMLAELDHKGSIAAAGAFSVTIGEALGPALGASTVEQNNFAGVLWLAVLLFALSIVLMVPSGQRVAPASI